MKYGYRTADPFLYSALKELARKNRNNSTDAERRLWYFINNGQLGVKFQRQHIIDRFIADFACIDKKLVVEVDGGYHQLPEQQVSDEERTEILQSFGFKVVRFTNNEIIQNVESVVTKIKEYIK